ncbi:MAG: hypothetical protein WD038_02945 [Balneolales bacterium]
MDNTQTDIQAITRTEASGAVSKVTSKEKALRAEVLDNFNRYLQQELKKRNKKKDDQSDEISGQKLFFELIMEMMLQDSEMIKLLSKHHDMKKVLIYLLHKLRREAKVSDLIPYSFEMRKSAAFHSTYANTYSHNQIRHQDPIGSTFSGKL